MSLAAERPPSDPPRPPSLHLRAGGVSLVLDARDGSFPPSCTGGTTSASSPRTSSRTLAARGRATTVPNDLDEPAPHRAVLPEHAAGWNGRPGLAGSAVGPRLVAAVHAHRCDVDTATRRAAAGWSPRARRRPRASPSAVEVELLPSGLLRQRARVTAVPPATSRFTVGRADADPARAAGRHRAVRPGRALGPRALAAAACRSSSACTRGRTGAAAPARTPRCPRRRHRRLRHARRGGLGGARRLERQPRHLRRAAVQRATRCSAAASCCCPARCGWRRARPTPARGSTARTAPGSTSCRGPVPHATCAPGPHHPRTPAPGRAATPGRRCTSTTTSTGSTALAGAAAEVGAERFVLDDGWFRAPPRRPRRARRLVRRRATSGRDGLHPLVDGRARARAWSSASGSSRRWSTPTPTWPARTRTGSCAPAAGCRRASRYQQVLDLAHPDAYAYLLERLDALLTEYAIAYLKWDHNRDLHRRRAPPDGAPGVHAQTLAVYRLLDELRARHPGVEIESCSSGGGAGRPRRSWSAPTGSGPATASTPWSASRSSAGPRCCCRRSWSAAHVGAPRAAHHRPHPRPVASAPAPRCSAPSASSGT